MPRPSVPVFFKTHATKLMLVLVAVIIIIAAAFISRWYQSSMHTYDFSQSVKVGSTSDLRLTFPELMNEQSVEEHLTVPNDLRATKKWEAGVLIFHPTEKMKLGSTYSFHIDRNALQKNGQILGRDIDFTFIVSGAPAVSTFIPAADATNIPATTAIAIIFDRPVAALTQVQGENAGKEIARWPVTIDPPVEGKWLWLSTTTAEFRPAQSLTPSTKYTVHVPAGIVTTTGDATEKDLLWSFETLRPEMTATEPAQGSQVAGPTTDIVLSFNMEMDLASAEKNISMSISDTTPSSSAPVKPVNMDPFMGMMTSSQVMIVPSSVPADLKSTSIGSLKYRVVKDEKTGKTMLDKHQIVVVPKDPLRFGKTYVVTVAKGIQGTQGNLGSKADTHLLFSTVSDLKAQSGAMQYGYITIHFNNPMDVKTFKQNVTIAPEPSNWKDIDVQFNDYENNMIASFDPELKPSTSYVITVKKTVQDAYGQHLKEPYTFTIKTDPVPSKVFIESKGEFGFFEKSRPPVFYLNAVNVSTMNVEFAKLSLPDFIQMHNVRKNNYDTPVSLVGKEMYKAWDIKPKQNKHDTWEAMPFDVQKQVSASLGSGIYALTLKAPEYKKDWGDNGPVVNVQYFALTNIALTLKYSGNKSLVWATNMTNGDPVAGATIRYYRSNSQEVLSGVTDSKGFFETPIDIKKFATDINDYQPEFWVTAEKNGDVSFVSSNWNDGIRPYDFDGLSQDFRSPMSPDARLESTMYTERTVYRPGDTVSFKGIARFLDWNGKMSLPDPSKSVQITVTDPQGKELMSKTMGFSAFGTFNGTFAIGADAALGDYSIQAKVMPQEGNDWYQSTLYANFAVLAYRKPEYQVDVTTEKTDYFSGDTVNADISGLYYFGAPMSGAKVVWRAQTTDYFFNKYTDGWYSFALEDAWCWWNCERGEEPLSDGSGVLDATGHLKIHVPVNLDTKGVSQVLSIEADITDPNNQVVSNRVSVPVHKSAVYVGIRADDYIVTPGSSAQMSIVTVKPDGTPQSNQAVQLSLYSRVWNTVKKKGVDGQYYYDNETKDTFERNMNAVTDDHGKATVKVPIDTGGQYIVQAATKDTAGHEAKSSTSIYSWSDTFVNWPHPNNDRLSIVADKPEYNVGDTAKLLVKSPYQGKGIHALITIERENVMSKRVIDVTSTAQTIEVPITEEMIPNAYVSVVIVKPRMGETFNEFGLDTGMPAFKIGYVKLVVDKKQKALTVSISTDKERYAPGEKVTATIKALDWQGKPVKGEFSLGVVDMSVLALTGFQMPDPVATFYSERGLGVLSSNMLMYMVELFKPGSKGGGGGSPEDRKRMNFKDTAYWNPTIITDTNGEGNVSFTLPDNLTTWQLLTIGSTQKNLFGAAVKTVLETKHVILRPVNPRFAVHGDTVELGAIVHNFLPTTQTFTVSLSGKGFTPNEKSSLQVTIKPDAMAKLTFPVTIDVADKMTFDFKAESPEARDEIQQSIPLYPFGTIQSVATSGITASGTTEHILAPSKKDSSDGSLSISVSPTIATYLPGGLSYLAQYPYGCAEQTMSSLLPNISLKKMQGFDAFKYVDDATLQTNVVTGLQKIYKFQRGDGGFGYWDNSDRSYPYLSAYILYGLQIAANSGYTVDSGVMNNTRNYLQTVLRDEKMTDPVDLSTRAYILYVLSEGGSTDVSMLNNLYDKKDSLPLFAKAQLSMALKNANTSSTTKKAGDLIKEIENRAKVDGRGTHFEEDDGAAYGWLMHTNTRATATVLRAMLRNDPQNPLIPRTVRYLLQVREDGHWDTTQSTVESVLALVDYLKSTNELDANFDAVAVVGGKPVIQTHFDKKNVLTRAQVKMALDTLPDNSMTDVNISKTGKGVVYYDMLLSYFYKANDIPAAEQGMSISRTIEQLPGNAKTVTVGQTYKVTLTMTVPEDRHFVAVESPLPTGMEAIDTNLQTSQQNLLSGVANPQDNNWWSIDYYKNALWHFTHTELRDDQVFLFAEDLPAGIYRYEYLVRATTPGRFHYRPARIWEMYFPENFGQTNGEWFTIADDHSS